MDITSLLITLAGIIFIFALYMMSRIARSKLPKQQQTNIPELKDKDGNAYSSVLDDIPATDGSTPSPSSQNSSAQHATDSIKKDEVTEKQSTEESPESNEIDQSKPDNDNKVQKNTQHILFISAQEGSMLDGNMVKKSLEASGLSLGENDIYHYSMMANSKKISLFRVANGMEPWTLKDEDLLNKKLAGLSVVMITPSKINDIKAMKTFINTTKKLAASMQGLVKNQQQQPLTIQNEQEMINFATQK